MPLIAKKKDDADSSEVQGTLQGVEHTLRAGKGDEPFGIVCPDDEYHRNGTHCVDMVEPLRMLRF